MIKQKEEQQRGKGTEYKLYQASCGNADGRSCMWKVKAREWQERGRERNGEAGETKTKKRNGVIKSSTRQVLGYEGKKWRKGKRGENKHEE